MAIKEVEEKYPEIAKAFKEIQKEQYELFSKKMLSYGKGNISMGTNLDTPEDKKFALTAVWIRSLDKMNRLKNLVLDDNKNYVDDESIKDTYMDLANYSIIAQIVYDNDWK